MYSLISDGSLVSASSKNFCKSPSVIFQKRLIANTTAGWSRKYPRGDFWIVAFGTGYGRCNRPHDEDEDGDFDECSEPTEADSLAGVIPSNSAAQSLVEIGMTKKVFSSIG